MKITGLEIMPLEMKRRDSGWRTSLYASSVVGALVVKLHTDEGLTGLGAATVLRVLGDTPDGIHATLRDVFAPLLKGKDPFQTEAILGELQRAALGAHHARCAIDLALHDVKAKALGVPVYQLLGGAARTKVPVIRMVGIKEPIEQAREAAALVAEGYRYLKLKIGVDPDEDVARVAEVRRAVGDGVTLTVDANGAYDVKTAIRVIRQLEQQHVVVAEDPVPWTDIDGLALLTRAVDMPVMADLGVVTPADAIRIVRRQAADVVSIKLFKMGGILAAQKTRAVCEAAGMPYHLASTATTRVIEAGSVHFAVACPQIAFACEFGEFAGLDGDIAEGLDVRDGMLCVPEGPGLGVTVAA